MKTRYGWLLKSVLVGFAVLAVVYYLFSIAYSIVAYNEKMIDLLSHYNDTTIQYSNGADAIFLAFIGTLTACFTGGMAARSLSRVDVPSDHGLLITSIIVVVFVTLVADVDIYLRWSNTLNMAQAGALSLPVEPTPFGVILFIMLIFDGFCFLASVAGGAVVELAAKRG